jgi:WD40 repeat protein
MVQEFYPAISCGALQVYESALEFMPQCRLRTAGMKAKSSGVRLVSESYARWGVILRVIEGHGGPVNSIAYSPNGQRIVSGSYDTTVRVWNAVTGESTAVLQGHEDWVRSVGFSPDGQRIVSGSNDRTVRVWNAVTGESAAVLQGHESAVTSVGFSPDGQRIVSGSSDTTVRVWNAVTGESTAVLQGHEREVTSVGFSPDGQRIVSGSFDTTVRVWNAVTGESTAVLQGHESYVTSVGFSPDGQFILSYDGIDNQKIWTGGEHFPSLTSSQAGAIAQSEPSSLSFSFDKDSGWLFSTEGSDMKRRRLCWIPVNRRPTRDNLKWHGHVVALGSVSGAITILSITFP